MTPAPPASPRAIRIVVCAEPESARRKIAQLLGSTDGFDVLAQAENLRTAERHLQVHQPAVLVIDLSGRNGWTKHTVRDLREQTPATQIVVLIADGDAATARDTVIAGALAVVHQSDLQEELVPAVWRAAGGEQRAGANLAPEPASGASGLPVQELSQSQTELLSLIALGHSSAAISDQLHLSADAIQTHRAHITSELELMIGEPIEADDRSSAQDCSDEAASQRDRAATERDAAAEERDRSADTRMHELQDIDDASGGSPRRARGLRARAVEDRRRAECDRDLARRDRALAAADRQSGERDRDESRHDREHAATDELTGARRRGVGLEDLQHEIDRAGRTHETLIAAYIDIDRLKRTNDVYGHTAGDELIHDVVRAIRQRMRSYDLLIRLGGDEFLCVLLGLSADEARVRFEQLNSDLLPGPAARSISVGISELRPGEASAELIDRADRDLLAGRGGGDRRRPAP